MLMTIHIQGAFAGLMVGLLAGGIRMILDFVLPAPLCGREDTRSEAIQKLLSMHYLYFGMMLFGLTIIVTVVVSHFTPPESPKRVSFMIKN